MVPTCEYWGEPAIINVGGQKPIQPKSRTYCLKWTNVEEATVWGWPNPVTGQIVAARGSVEPGAVGEPGDARSADPSFLANAAVAL